MEYLKTASGRLAPRKEVRRIQGVYYHYDDLAKVNNSYHRKNNGKVIYDIDNKKWVLRGEMPHNAYTYILYFIGNSHVYGFSLTKGTYKLDNTSLYFLSREQAVTLGYLYTAGKYTLSATKPKRGRDPEARNYPYSFDPDNYDIHYNIMNKKYPVDNSFTPEIQEFLDQLLGTYSIGMEIETSSGFLTRSEMIEYQMFPLRDGSIDNTEFCTAPIDNSTDLDRFMRFMEEDFGINHRCSMHVHVGNLPYRDKKFLVAFYYLCYRLQHELHSCVPSYRKNMVEQKDYGKYLKGFGLEYIKNIDAEDFFPIIYKFITGGNTFYSWEEEHPLEGNNKWNYPMRYYYVNVLNYLFKSSGTVEFRLFPSVKWADIAFVWTSLCLMIVEYAVNNTGKILANRDKINMEEVIHGSSWPTQLKDLILEYVRAFQNNSYEETIYQREHFDNYMIAYERISRRLKPKLFTCLIGTEERVTRGNANVQKELVVQLMRA